MLNKLAAAKKKEKKKCELEVQEKCWEKHSPIQRKRNPKREIKKKKTQDTRTSTVEEAIDALNFQTERPESG